LHFKYKNCVIYRIIIQYRKEFRKEIRISLAPFTSSIKDNN